MSCLELVTLAELIVVKIGGGKGVDEESVCANLAELSKNRPVILVHGASNDANELSERFGLTPRFVTSASGQVSRFTDEQTIRVFETACMQVNSRIVRLLRGKGVAAVGLNGASGVLQAQRKESVRVVEDGKKKILHGDYTGRITGVDARLLSVLLENKFLPVIAPLAASEKQEVLNVDGDRAAAQIAASLGANDLVILSNVAGVLRNVSDASTLVRTLSAGELASCGYAEGRMKKKLLAAQEAVSGGVRRVIIADSRSKNPVENALQGNGTVIS